jgi:succinate-acetate transporter protein
MISTGDGQTPTDSLAATRVFLRPVASPFSLGFAALATATLVMSGHELGWYGADEHVLVGIAIALFAPGLQALASIFGFLARDVIAATAMGVLSGTWLVTGITLIVIPAGFHSDVLGTFLFAPGAVLLISSLGAATVKLVPALVIGTAGLRFLLSGAAQTSGNGTVSDVAGIRGLVLCALALYAAASLEIEALKHRTILPTLRRGEGRRALRAPLADQVREVATEPGVREQL